MIMFYKLDLGAQNKDFVTFSLSSNDSPGTTLSMMTTPLHYQINLSVENGLTLGYSHTFTKSKKQESKSHSSTSHRVWWTLIGISTTTQRQLEKQHHAGVLHVNSSTEKYLLICAVNGFLTSTRLGRKNNPWTQRTWEISSFDPFTGSGRK